MKGTIFLTIGYSKAVRLLKEKANFLESFIGKEVVNDIVLIGESKVRMSQNPISRLISKIKGDEERNEQRR